MSIIGLVGMGASIGGFWSKDAKEFQRQYFAGEFEVTAGSHISGVYGSQYQTVFGPSVQHTVDLKFGGLLGTSTGEDFLDPILSLLLGMGGNVDVVYGPRTTATYGSVLEIERGPEVSKRGALPGLMSGGLGGLLSPEAAEIAAADIKTARIVSLLSVLNNLTIGITQMVMHFKYPDYHRPRPENPVAGEKEKPDEYDQMSWDSAPRILDSVVTQLPRRLLAIIAIVEKAGGLENGWQAFKDSAKLHWDKWLKYVVVYFLGGLVALGLSVAAFGVGLGIGVLALLPLALKAGYEALKWIKANIWLTVFILMGLAAAAALGFNIYRMIKG